MYRIKIGINVLLEEGETWEKAPGTIVPRADDKQEVRFEPGDEVEAFPALVDVKSLLDYGAIEPVKRKRGG